MKTKHSTAWKGSKQPRKQRKYRFNAPLHIKGKFLTAKLIKELRAKHGVARLRVRTGDKVRVLRGQFKGREGKVESVNVKTSKILINKVDFLKKDGATRVPYPVDASNVIIVDIDASDKRRNEKLKASAEKAKTAKKN